MSARNALERATPIIAIGIASLACTTGNREVNREYTLGTGAAVGVEGLADAWTRRSVDLLTRADIVANPVISSGTAYDAVSRLRPRFLESRSASVTSIGRRAQPAVFIGGLFAGEVDVLRTIPASAVVEMRHVRPMEAMNRYGPSYTSGVVVVRLER